MAGQNYFIGVDIGGTFTDVVLAEATSHRLFTAKTLTTPDSPGRGVIAAMQDALAQAQAQPADIQRVVHATTLATNLILERKGSKVAYITTKGFGDLFVIGKERVVGADRYNLFLEKSPPLVERRLTLEVEERINRLGEEIVPFNQRDAVEGIRRLAREGLQAVAICFLHSYANPAHERAMADLVRQHLPGTYVALSSEVWPEFREYERASTTVMSAYVGPTISSYVEALEKDLRKMGLVGSFEIMQSSGGVMSAAAVARKPIYSVESGPAAGVIAAAHLGQLCNQPNIISFDMGGTTAKAGLIRHGKPSITHDFRVGGHLSAGTRAGGHPIKIPVIDLAEVGAGGGSIAWVDAGGALQVGPLSAGAAPGPACYGFGGDQPTVTDANLILGYLDADYFLGGKMRIYPEKSLAAIEPLAKKLGLDPVQTAKGIYEIANTHMGSAVRVVTIQRGVDPREYAVMAFGGAGPVHAVKVAEQFEIPNIIVPVSPGLASAFGLLVSDMAEDYVATLLMDSRDADIARMRQLLDQLSQTARAALRAQGVAESNIAIQRLIDVRFKHQSHELQVPIPDGPIDAATVTAAEEAFRKLYNELYGVLPNDPCQFVNFGVRATGIVPKPELAKAAAGDGNARRALKGSRQAYFAESGAFVEVSVYDRTRLLPGDQVAGPAIMEEPDSTTLCPPGYALRVDEYLNLHINRR
ncbi:MAG: hydantoinase/oxoprolinase family protein [Candidatus Binataceae bacterium]